MKVSQELKRTLRILRKFARPEELDEISHYENAVSWAQSKWEAHAEKPAEQKLAVNFAVSATTNEGGGK